MPKQSRRALNKYVEDFDVRDNSRCTFSLRKRYYGLIFIYNALNDGFVSASDDN